MFHMAKTGPVSWMKSKNPSILPRVGTVWRGMGMPTRQVVWMPLCKNRDHFGWLHFVDLTRIEVCCWRYVGYSQCCLVCSFFLFSVFQLFFVPCACPPAHYFPVCLPCPSRFVVAAMSSEVHVKAVEVCSEIFGQPFLGAFGMVIASSSCKSKLLVTLQPPMEPRVSGVVGWLDQLPSSPRCNSRCFIEHWS